MTTTDTTFGSGGSEPYAKALRHEDQVLFIQDADAAHDTEPQAMNMSRWHEDADETDFGLLAHAASPVLDIGCGPGRMVTAALNLGLSAVGLDVSPTALDIARRAGVPVVEGSVFDPVAREGEWMTTLLIDGNIGIGGDVSALLARCVELIAPAGSVIVEVHDVAHTDRAFDGTVTDLYGHESDSFRWAEIGRDALVAKAGSVGLKLAQAWVADDRTFCRLVRA